MSEVSLVVRIIGKCVNVTISKSHHLRLRNDHDRLFLAEYLLNNVSYFMTIPHPLVKILVRKLQSMTVVKGEYVFHKGDEGDKMFIIYSGTA